MHLLRYFCDASLGPCLHSTCPDEGIDEGALPDVGISDDTHGDRRLEVSAHEWSEGTPKNILSRSLTVSQKVLREVFGCVIEFSSVM